ncbi:MAG: GNAT family N-acetyltransferase [Anaerolineales bacterium]|nr:GNAT family N-acetyltransferase [Anaerolineales bacterium]
MPLTLHPFERADYARLIGWAESPEFLMQWAGPIFTYPLDAAQLDRYRLLASGDPPTRYIYTARLDDRPVGHIELSQVDRRQRSATLARVLVAPEARGRGIGRRMVTAALAVGFDQLGLHRIDLNVFDFNTAALACYERVGFVTEGRRRDARRVGDAWRSVITMSMLEDEWAAHRPTPTA